ncbi:SDR family oxidoreductase [Gammaproteobacteria bacterium]|nr:SDR family oxidoreductase [Gammaproteobacteria bacterium]
MSNRRILVTGAAGFLGSHLCEHLLKRGDYVIGLDNLSSGSIVNLKKLSNSDQFEFVEADVVNPIEVRCDEIFNLACPASPIQYQSDPISTIKASILGAYNLLELAKENSSKILQASTSEVYGDPLEHPQSEDYWGNVNPIGIRSCYDEGKRAAETLFMDYQRAFDLEIKIVRIFNTYGPRMLPNDGRVISNFIVQAINNDPITIYGDGNQTRSFCYVEDLINGFLLMMDSEKEIIGPINMGNPDEYSILDIAEIIVAKIGSDSEIIKKPLPEDDPKKRRPDISKAEKYLDWRPSIELDRGLEETIKFFRDSLT